MSNLICPFCQQELNQDDPQSIECRNSSCEKTWFMYGSKELWQELIRTKELLEVESSEHELCHDAMVKRTEEVNRTRKALDVAVDALNKYEWNGSFDHNGEFNLDMKEMTLAHKALEQIKELEQKDVK